jgi:chloramphenicol 3-O-phosphotransferase
MITTLRRQVVKQCPYKAETDIGELVITIGGPAPELHALAAAIAAITAEPISHEEFTAAVADLLPAGARVDTTWHTAGWTVGVTDVAAVLG